jgi:hypothetical protein
MVRQRESIQYHCKRCLTSLLILDNHVLLTMYREFLNVKKPFSHPKLSSVRVQQSFEAYHPLGNGRAALRQRRSGEYCPHS